MVDSPFLKPEMLGSKKRLLINIVDVLLEHQTLEDLGERGKYRDRSSCLGLSTLGTGEMCAVFQMRGNYELEMHTLMIRARGPVRKSPTCSTYWTGIWSTPVEQSNLNRVISLRTSSVDTVRSWKG